MVWFFREILSRLSQVLFGDNVETKSREIFFNSIDSAEKNEETFRTLIKERGGRFRDGEKEWVIPGPDGKTPLTEHKQVGDNYFGNVGAAGHAKAENFTQNQTQINAASLSSVEFDLGEAHEQLTQVRKVAASRANTEDEIAASAVVISAETAARKGDKGAVREALGTLTAAGANWIGKIAMELSATVIAKLIEAQLNLPK